MYRCGQHREINVTLTEWRCVSVVADRLRLRGRTADDVLPIEERCCCCRSHVDDLPRQQDMRASWRSWSGAMWLQQAPASSRSLVLVVRHGVADVTLRALISPGQS